MNLNRIVRYLKRRIVLFNPLHLATRVLQLEQKVTGLQLAHEYQARNLRRQIDPKLAKAPTEGQITFQSDYCKAEHFFRPEYAFWCNEMKTNPKLHRKQWEWVYITQTVFERGLLASEKKGLGFAVGKEPLSAVFVSRGCEIVASDGSWAVAKAQGWNDSNQYSSNLQDLNQDGICDKELFAKKASFREVDMRAIPNDLQGFDFCWSSCALEHLGTIENGLQFIRDSLKTLKPGGFAIHTTELNVTDPINTISEDPHVVLFRPSDLHGLMDEFKRQGHKVSYLNLEHGKDPMDYYSDVAPYYFDPVGNNDEFPHLKMYINGFITTSVGLIIQKSQS